MVDEKKKNTAIYTLCEISQTVSNIIFLMQKFWLQLKFWFQTDADRFLSYKYMCRLELVKLILDKLGFV